MSLADESYVGVRWWWKGVRCLSILDESVFIFWEEVEIDS